MKGLSIIIPCYNEQARGSFIERINRIRNYVVTLDFPCEVIFVNDGSDDDTELILLKEDVIFISYPKNRGRGYAYRRGIRKAIYDKILIMDADLSVPITNIPLFYELCESKTVVIGTRVYEDKRNYFRKFLTKLSKKATSYLNVKDSQCGFKMFHRELYNKVSKYLCCNRWLGDTELLSFFKEVGAVFIESDVEWMDYPISTMKSIPALISSGLEYIKIRRGIREYERRKNL